MLQRLVTSVTDALTCVNAGTLMAHQGTGAVGPRASRHRGTSRHHSSRRARDRHRPEEGYVGPATAPVRLTPAEFQRAIESDAFCLVVVSGLEAGTAPVTVQIILEPLKHPPYRAERQRAGLRHPGRAEPCLPVREHGVAPGHDSLHSDDNDTRPGFGAAPTVGDRSAAGVAAGEGDVQACAGFRRRCSGSPRGRSPT